MYNFWPTSNRAPWSGNVTQDMLQGWFSPTINVEIEGDAEIEEKIIREHASYGKQLGRLADAVLALAKHADATNLKEVKDLAEIAVPIKDAVKAHNKQKQQIVDQAEDAMARLAEHDAGAARRIASRFFK